MKKKILALCVVICMFAVAVVGGTLAYFTDSDTEENVFVFGDVNVEIEEEFTPYSEILPGVDVTKVVKVKNVGGTPTYNRVMITLPANVNPNWSVYVGEDKVWTIEDTVENADGSTTYTLWYNNQLAADAVTEPCLESVTLDEYVDYDGDTIIANGTIMVNVTAEAIQAKGFASAADAFANFDIQTGIEAGTTTVLNAANDEELADVLAEIKSNSDYWNKEVVIKLASNTYSADHVINQYPEWNGVVGTGDSGNNCASGVASANFTKITLMADSDQNVEFTGNVTVNGFGNAGTGFGTAADKGSTTFVNVTFDGENNDDNITMYVKAAANDVTFKGCTFENATHITVGGSGPDTVGLVSFTDCTFDNGNCISGYVKTLNVKNCNAANAYNGFINVQGGSVVTVEGGTIDAEEYFIRTRNAATLNVTGATIAVSATSDGQYLVNCRDTGCKATFTGCTLPTTYAVNGVSLADGTLVINN